jgi:amidase
VYGHKPTHGIIPLRGHVPGPPGTLAEVDLAVVGPLARAASDLALAMTLIVGPPADRAQAWRLELPRPHRQRLRDYRVLAWLDDRDYPVDPTVVRRLAAAVAALRAAGVTVDEGATPGLRLAELVEVYLRLLWPILTFGYPPEELDELARIGAAVADGPRDHRERVARYGTARHHDWLAANEARERMRLIVAEIFARYDVMLLPGNQVTAIAHDHSEPMEARTLTFAGRKREYLDLMAWIALATALLLPATVVPAGLAEDGMPVGLQIVGPYLHDYTTLDFADRASQVLGGFVPPPAYGDV